MIPIKRYVAISLLLLCKLSVVQAARDDVLVIVNDNSLDSPQIGAYYAQQRDINPANIVHINVPNSYFINWSDFRSMRDQLIRFMQLNTLDDPTLIPVICTDGEPPYYCNASMDQLLAHTTIRYLVTTRGVPTRMTVDGSTLSFPSAPTSLDNYLKYWLINYFTDDVQLKFTERELAFADGSGMRTVQPAMDRELIIGRIDGLDLNAAKALVDRAIAVENAGIFGTWYGSTQFWSWRDENTGQAIYPSSGSSLPGWRYGLGMWREDRVECADYLNFSGFLGEGKAPAHCRLQFNDDSDSDLQFSQGIHYPAPGNSQSREPRVINALGYQGWLDGQATLGGFDTLLNWRKNDQCTVTLCDDAADPASCQENSSDIFAELNTDCVGVADGFMGYNHQSWPMSYLAIWPTGWFQSDRTGNSGWNDGGHGDLNQLAFPEVRNDEGFDDSSSLWFRNTDQTSTPLCFAGNDFSLSPSVPCVDQRRLVLSQKITLTAQTLDNNNPQTYRVALRYRTLNVATAVDLRVRLFIHETGSGDAQIDYGVQTLASLTPVDTTGWVSAEVLFTLNPLLHNTSSYDGLKITLDTPNAFAGDLGIDVISVQLTTEGLELVSNGSFSLGHHQVASGDHAANFLNRLGGVAAWGSVGHHQSAGCAFCFNGLESMIYFLRGLPLGDAVWFNEAQNSGILYGDPLYSPVAVRLNPLNSVAIQNGSVDLVGSTVNGRDLLQVNTNYTVDVCTADDFYLCDQAQSWQATGISGSGGSENTPLGTLDTSLLAADDFTLRLQVSSLNTLTGSSQVFADYFTMSVNDPPVATDASVNVVENTFADGALAASDEEGDALTYSIVSNGSKGTAIVLNPVLGFYRYTPNANATGTDNFTFKVNDGQQDSNIATVNININTVNNSPVAADSTLNTNEDSTAMAVLSASDIDGDALTYSLAANATKGTVLISNASTGAYSYTPNANANGSDSFTFKANDGQADSNIASVDVNIAAVNDAPVAVLTTLNINEDNTAMAVLSASDIDGDALTYSLVANAAKGTVLITNASTGAYSYTPNANANGSDSFTFKVNDGQADSNIASVDVNIATVNDAPEAVFTTLITDEDSTAMAVLSASDIDKDALTYSLVANAAKGTVLITNASTGVYSYTPNANVTGSDSFTFKVNDGLNDSSIAIVSVNILAVNDSPVATNSNQVITEDVTTNGVLNVSDIDGDALSYSLVTNAEKGTVLITNASTGAYSYTPNANANGSDSFTFKANDDQANSNIASVNVSITAVNDMPVATSVSISTFSNEPVTGTLSAVDADGDTLIFSLASNASQGTVVINGANFTYTPNPGATGTDSFTYVVSDGQVNSDIAIATIQLQEVKVVNNDSAASAGSLNMFFVVLISFLPGLRFISVGRV